MTTKVYLIGPMSGIKSFNYPAFNEAASFLSLQGFDVVSPTASDSFEAYTVAMASPDGDGAAFLKETGITYEELIGRSITKILAWKPDMLVALPGWEESSGASKEHLVGKALGIPTVLLDDYDPDHGFPVESNGIKVYDAGLYDADGKWINDADNPLRQRTVTGGVKDNLGKAPIDLIPWEPLYGAAGVLAYGARKYKPNNWRLGLLWSETWSSLQRHLWAWKEGEDLDLETGLPHVDHAMCQLLFLSTFYHDMRYAQFDDRWTSSDHEDARA